MSDRLLHIRKRIQRLGFRRRSGRSLILLCAFALLTFSGCRPTRHLGEGQLLFRGSEVTFVEKTPPTVRKLENELNNFAQPDPNTRVLGLPVRLGIYNTFDPDNDGKGVGHWIKTRIGEPPVLYQESDLRRSRLRMENYLAEQGYLQAGVGGDTTLVKKKVRATYTVQAGPRYRLRRYETPLDTGRLAALIRQVEKSPPLLPGEPLELRLLEQERNILARKARSAGYYLVNADNFFYYLDTLAGPRQADIYLRLSPPKGSGQYDRFRIGQTYVVPSYQADESVAADTLHLDDLHLIQYDTFLRPRVLDELVRQEAGEWFSPEQQDRTLNHLSGLGIYKFVNIKYQRRESDSTHFLDRMIYLTPDLPQYFSAQVEVSNEPGFIGSELQLSYTHRNLFRGAEQLNIRLTGGILTEIGNADRLLRALEVTGDASLQIPRFLFPWLKIEPKSISPPRTVFRLNGQYLFDFQNFTLNSVLAQAGYRWNPTSLVSHELYPLNISQQQLIRSTDAFEERLRDNARLRASVEDVFIFGINYRYLYAEPDQLQERTRYFLLGTAETSGNLTSVLSPNGELFGRPFTQYLRFELDGRRYYRIGEGEFVSRLNLGAGITYGQTEVMPFSKQFSVGGSNSIRAFRIRRLGPGRSDDFLDEETTYRDQTGDLRIEGNLEYRFPIISYLRGAVFADAGNIWLLQDPGGETPEGLFKLDRFYKDIAVGAGLGLRLDIDLFVIRLDVAFPLRRPWLLPGNPWIDRIRPLSADWRRENLTWHLALGYPF